MVETKAVPITGFALAGESIIIKHQASPTRVYRLVSAVAHHTCPPIVPRYTDTPKLSSEDWAISKVAEPPTLT